MKEPPQTRDKSKPLNSVIFTPHQLRQILSAYAEGVLRKGWRDYAIDSFKEQSVFSVIDHSDEQAGSIALYSVSANRGKNGTFYRLFRREAQIMRSESFLEVLNAFRALDTKDGSTKGKGNKHLRIIE